MKFVYWSLNNCTELSVVAHGKDRDGLHFEKISLNFSKFSYPSLQQHQKCSMDSSSCKTVIDVLVLNLKAMFWALVKVKRKDFS